MGTGAATATTFLPQPHGPMAIHEAPIKLFCVIVGKSLHVFLPRSSHLYSEGNSSTYPAGCCKGSVASSCTPEVQMGRT